MGDFFEREEKVVDYKSAESLSIKLTTGGKLSAPPVVSVTDYTMEDVLKLSTATSENLVELLVEILQARLQEDFDVRLLHENEMGEILMNLYANFWNQLLLDYPYPYEEGELEELVEKGIITESRKKKIENGDEVPKCDVPIGKIQLNTIRPDFKEPIVIRKDENYAVKFRLARVGDFLLAEKFTKERYAIQDLEFSDIRSALERGDDSHLDQHQLTKFYNFMKERSLFFLENKQALLLKGIVRDGQDVPLTTIEEKRKEYRKLNKRVWDIYTGTAESVKFGLDPEVTVVSPFTGEPVARRFQFQIMEFIPTDESYDSSGYDVSFGDGDENAGDGGT